VTVFRSASRCFSPGVDNIVPNKGHNRAFKRRSASSRPPKHAIPFFPKGRSLLKEQVQGVDIFAANSGSIGVPVPGYQR